MSTETVRPSILNEGQVIKNVDQAFGMDPIENDPYQAEAEADWAAYVKFRREQLGGFTTENPDGRVVLRNNDGTYKSIKSIPVESDKEYRNRLYDESATTDTTDMPDSFRTWPGYNGDQSSSEAPQDTAEENVQEEAMPKQEESASKKKTEVWRAGEKDIYEEGQPVHRVINPRLNEEPTGARYWMQGRTETRNPAHRPYQPKQRVTTKTSERILGKLGKPSLRAIVGGLAIAATLFGSSDANKYHVNHTSSDSPIEQSEPSLSNVDNQRLVDSMPDYEVGKIRDLLLDSMPQHKTESVEDQLLVDDMPQHEIQESTAAPEKDVVATDVPAHEVISTGEVNEEDTVGPEEMAEEIGIMPLNEIDNASETIEESGGDLLTGQDSTESEESDTPDQETDNDPSELVEKLTAEVVAEPGDGITHVIQKVLQQAGYTEVSPEQLYDIYMDVVTDPGVGPEEIFEGDTISVQYDSDHGELRMPLSEPTIAQFTLGVAKIIAKYIPLL